MKTASSVIDRDELKWLVDGVLAAAKNSPKGWPSPHPAAKADLTVTARGKVATVRLSEPDPDEE